MTYSLLAARAAIGAAAVAIIALAALHLLKPDLDPSRTMISQYALGRYGGVMTLCFAAFAAGSVFLFAALVADTPSLLGRIGLAFLLAAAVGLTMGAIFSMDPVSTPSAQMSFSGRMHGVSFLIGVPSEVLAVLLLTLAFSRQASHASTPLWVLTSLIWLSLIVMIVVMVMVGPGKTPDPDGPGRFPGWPNRMFMIAYGAWLIVAAWPRAR
jgi:Protein of unknown function (DUF998)